MTKTNDFYSIYQPLTTESSGIRSTTPTGYIVSSTFHQPSHTSIATTEHIDKLEVDLYNKLNGRITES